MGRSTKTVPPRGRYSRYNSLYSKLGVSPDASAETIRSAYRVLENVYRPDGAYTDDVMAQAFAEIAGAAAILCDPKTRKLYDRGYIDETGGRTKAGLARASRIRKAGVFGTLAVFGFAGLLVFNLWSGSSIRTRDDVQVSGLPAALNDTGAQGVDGRSDDRQVSTDRAPLPAPLPSQQEVSQKAKSQADEKSDSSSPGGSAAAEANARDYLPPETLFHPGSSGGLAKDRERAAQKSTIPPNQAKRNRRLAQKIERQKQPGLSNTAPSEIWESNIWFPGSQSHAQDPAPGSALRTAHCLACLANDQANCTKTCP